MKQEDPTSCKVIFEFWNEISKQIFQDDERDFQK